MGHLLKETISLREGLQERCGLFDPVIVRVTTAANHPGNFLRSFLYQKGVTFE